MFIAVLRTHHRDDFESEGVTMIGVRTLFLWSCRRYTPDKIRKLVSFGNCVYCMDSIVLLILRTDYAWVLIIVWWSALRGNFKGFYIWLWRTGRAIDAMPCRDHIVNWAAWVKSNSLQIEADHSQTIQQSKILGISFFFKTLRIVSITDGWVRARIRIRTRST